MDRGRAGEVEALPAEVEHDPEQWAAGHRKADRHRRSSQWALAAPMAIVVETIPEPLSEDAAAALANYNAGEAHEFKISETIDPGAALGLWYGDVRSTGVPTGTEHRSRTNTWSGCRTNRRHPPRRT